MYHIQSKVKTNGRPARKWNTICPIFYAGPPCATFVSVPPYSCQLEKYDNVRTTIIQIRRWKIMLMTPTPTKRKDNKIKKTRTSVRAHTLNTTHKKKNGKKTCNRTRPLFISFLGITLPCSQDRLQNVVMKYVNRCTYILGIYSNVLILIPLDIRKGKACDGFDVF